MNTSTTDVLPIKDDINPRCQSTKSSNNHTIYERLWSKNLSQRLIDAPIAYKMRQIAIQDRHSKQDDFRKVFGDRSWQMSLRSGKESLFEEEYIDNDNVRVRDTRRIKIKERCIDKFSNAVEKENHKPNLEREL